MSWRAMAESGALAAIDRHFGDLVFELAGGSDLLAITAALVSSRRTDGHACLHLSEWAGRAPIDPGAEALEPLPDLVTWRAELLASDLCTDGGEPTPLVLDELDRLYLFRYWEAERDLARRIRERLAIRFDLAPDIAAQLRRLFATADAEADHHALAALAVARGGLTVITGGPGTGKTTTVARILALLLAGQPDLRIALAAPTGKAAARLGESIAAQLGALGLQESAQLPEPRTLHRLLGYSPHRDAFRHHADNPHPADLIVVDEASMVDLILMQALFAAARPGARVVLLGDSHQLTSVATGQVLTDLCAAAPAIPGPGLAAAYHAATGCPLQGREDPSGLADAVVALQRNYRFADQPGIGKVAEALVAGDVNAAMAALQSDSLPDLRLSAPADPDRLLDPVADQLRAYSGAASATDALDRFSSWQILCAVRAGPFGVDRINRRVEATLAELGMRTDRPWYRGRPVMVTVNDYATQLFNGDVGICWPDDEGRMLVWFRQPSGELRPPLSPSRLPSCETAWAITVHKSQGSEFDEVLLLLPDVVSPVCTAPLLYTALTRARRRAHTIADAEVLRECLGRRPSRASGLAEKLLGTPQS